VGCAGPSPAQKNKKIKKNRKVKKVGKIKKYVHA
jgi:hypothetical protein